MGAQDSSEDTEEECERLGGSLELYRESPWDGSWRGGCRKICEHRHRGDWIGSQEERLLKTLCCHRGEGESVLARASGLGAHRDPGGSEIEAEYSKTLRAQWGSKIARRLKLEERGGVGRGA